MNKIVNKNETKKIVNKIVKFKEKIKPPISIDNIPIYLGIFPKV